MSTKQAGTASHVSSMKNLDVRRLWEKLHNNDFRDNCFAYYREATFEDRPATAGRTSQFGARPRRAQPQMGFMRRIAVRSTEGRVALVLAGVLGLGIGVTRLLAQGSQVSSNDRVEQFMDTLRKDWDQYQSVIRKEK